MSGGTVYVIENLENGGREVSRKRGGNVPFPGFELLTLHTAKWLISRVDLSGCRIGETVGEKRRRGW